MLWHGLHPLKAKGYVVVSAILLSPFPSFTLKGGAVFSFFPSFTFSSFHFSPLVKRPTDMRLMAKRQAVYLLWQSGG